MSLHRQRSPAMASLPPDLMSHLLYLVDPPTFASMTTLNRSWRSHSQDPNLYRTQLRRVSSDTLGHGYTLDTIVEADLDHMQKAFGSIARSQNWPAYAEYKVKSIMTGQSYHHEPHDFSAYTSAYVSAAASLHSSSAPTLREMRPTSSRSDSVISISTPRSRPGTAMSHGSVEAETPLTGPSTIDESRIDGDLTVMETGKPPSDTLPSTPVRPSTPENTTLPTASETPKAGPSKKQEEMDAAAGSAAQTPADASSTPVSLLKRSVTSGTSRFRSVSLGAKSHKRHSLPLAAFSSQESTSSDLESEDFEPTLPRRRTTFGGHRSKTSTNDARQRSLSSLLGKRFDSDNVPAVPAIPAYVPLPEAPSPVQVESLRRRNTLIREDPYYRPSGTAPKAAAGAYRRSFSTSNLPLRPLSFNSLTSLPVDPPSFQSTPSHANSIAEEHVTDSSDAVSGPQLASEVVAHESTRSAPKRTRTALSRLSQIDSATTVLSDARSRSRSTSRKLSTKQAHSRRGLAGRSLRPDTGSEHPSTEDPAAKEVKPTRSARVAARVSKLRSKGGCSVM